MTINKVNHICDIFMPNEKRPIGNFFELFGEEFELCTIRFMRGAFGLQKGEKSRSPFGDELYDDYFILCNSNWLECNIYVSPERGLFHKTIGIKRKYKKDKDIIEKFNSISILLESAFIKAIVKEIN